MDGQVLPERSLAVSITVLCPHCDSRYQVNPDVIGKAMRCPNPDCRETFTAEMAPDVPSLPRGSKPVPRELDRPSPGDSDVLGSTVILSGLPDTNIAPRPTPIPGELPDTVIARRSLIPSAASKPRRDKYPIAERARPKPQPEGPKHEVAWSADAAPPGTEGPWSPQPEAVEPPPAPVFVRRKRRSPWRGVILTGLLLGIVGAIGATGIWLLRVNAITESRDADEAKASYESGNFPAAANRFEALATQFPGSPNAERYRFFAALAAARGAIDAPTSKDDPQPGAAKLAEFLTAHGSSPLAQAGSGFGSDIVDAGRKLADNLADFAGNRLKEYRAAAANPAAYRPDQVSTENLSAAEAAESQGTSLLPTLDRYREADGPGLDDQRKRFADLARDFARERDRLAVLAPIRLLPDDPTDDRIESAILAIRAAGLEKDAQAEAIVAAAKRRLVELIGFTASVAKPTAAPSVLVNPLLFAPPIAGSPEPKAPVDAFPEVAFVVARGVLYGLDAHSGSLLWGTRIASVVADLRTADVPVRVPASDGGPDWVLVASDLDGRPGLTARNARTGTAVWHQSFEAGFAGRPVVVGRRAYVPLADPLGTVVEIQIATGARLGAIQIRQPLGSGIVGVPGPTAGGGFLFVAADARRVFVFEVGREADDGREPPRLARVIATGHPRDSLRGEPLVIGSEEARFLVLPLANGPGQMVLKSLALPAFAELIADPAGTTQPADRTSDVTVPGWNWFPPACDGERLVLASDAGAFVAFGVNQAGNLDRPLFPLAVPKVSPPPLDTVVRSAVISSDDDGVWALVAGDLVRYRLAVDSGQGPRFVRHGEPRPLGEPTQRPQLLPHQNLAVVVTRTGPTSAARATAFDLASGQIRWQRQLGAVPTTAAIAKDGSAVLVDTEGGIYAIPAGEDAKPTCLAPPLANPAARARVAASADGSTIWVLAPEAIKNGRRLVVRRVVDGAVKPDTTATFADGIAGNPVFLGDSVVVPAGNGSLIRIPATGEPQTGPAWLASGTTESECFLTAVGADEFFATDGANHATRWRWPVGGGATPVAGPWDVREKIAMPVTVVDARRFAIVDRSGSMRLFESARVGEPLHRWRPGKDSLLPFGPPSGALSIAAGSDGPRIVYAIGGHTLVALDPENATPAWVVRTEADAAPATVGWAIRGGAIVATNRAGRVASFSLETGEPLGDTPAPPGAFATVPATPTGPDRAILQLADGTALPLPIRAK